jgi:lipid-binding SYLF domain-containing protein
MYFSRAIVSLGLLAGCAMAVGCATAPATNVDRQNLRRDADTTLAEMISRDPAVREYTRTAPAYAVFPSVGKGGALVGGAYGRGILYEGGVATGYVSLEQASIGAQLGGQSFAELLVLRNPVDIDALKDGRFTVGANVGVIVLSPEAAAQKGFDSDAVVFVLPRGGLMVDISFSGQQLKYQSFGA